jgi:hypothetical protein
MMTKKTQTPDLTITQVTKRQSSISLGEILSVVYLLLSGFQFFVIALSIDQPGLVDSQTQVFLLAYFLLITIIHYMEKQNLLLFLISTNFLLFYVLPIILIITTGEYENKYRHMLNSAIDQGILSEAVLVICCLNIVFMIAVIVGSKIIPFRRLDYSIHINKIPIFFKNINISKLLVVCCFILAWFLFIRFGYSFGSVSQYISGGAVSGGLRIFMFLSSGIVGVMWIALIHLMICKQEYEHRIWVRYIIVFSLIIAIYKMTAGSTSAIIHLIFSITIIYFIAKGRVKVNVSTLVKWAPLLLISSILFYGLAIPFRYISILKSLDFDIFLIVNYFANSSTFNLSDGLFSRILNRLDYFDPFVVVYSNLSVHTAEYYSLTEGIKSFLNFALPGTPFESTLPYSRVFQVVFLGYSFELANKLYWTNLYGYGIYLVLTGTVAGAVIYLSIFGIFVSAVWSSLSLLNGLFRVILMFAFSGYFYLVQAGMGWDTDLNVLIVDNLYQMVVGVFVVYLFCSKRTSQGR